MRKIFFIILTIGLLNSCEDVIEIDLPESASRPVIDATVEFIDNSRAQVVVNLTRSTDFFTEENPPIEDAVITLTTPDNSVVNIPHLGAGRYELQLFSIIETGNYQIELEIDGLTYSASESYEPTVPIIEDEQLILDNLDNLKRITVFYNDPAGIGNFYFFRYRDPNNFQIDVGDDEFTDGNRSPSIFFVDEDEDENVQATVSIMGVDRETFDYYRRIVEAERNSGNPFNAPPSEIRGNIVSNDGQPVAFGYFRVSQRFDYTFTRI